MPWVRSSQRAGSAPAAAIFSWCRRAGTRGALQGSTGVPRSAVPAARLAARAAAAGLDLTAPFDVDDWNARAPAAHRLPDFGRRALALVVANSRALWGAFVAALARDGDDPAEPDPLDRYVEREV